LGAIGVLIELNQGETRRLEAAFEETGAGQPQRGIKARGGEQAGAFEGIEVARVEGALGARCFAEAIAFEERGSGTKATMDEFADRKKKFRILRRFQNAVGLGIKDGLKNACGFGEVTGRDEVFDASEGFPRGDGIVDVNRR
jgi:hypothetical protein